MSFFSIPPTANITFDIFFNPNKALEPGAEQAVNRLIYQHVSLLPPINIHVSLFWLRKALNHCTAIIIYIKNGGGKSKYIPGRTPRRIYSVPIYPELRRGILGSATMCAHSFISFFFLPLPLLEEIRMWFHDQNRERHLTDGEARCLS